MLFVNHPNPARLDTELRFRIAQGGDVKLSVFDASGRRVRSLVSGVMAAGDHNVMWDGRDEQGRPVASGIYLYRIESGDFRAERKMIVMH